MRLIFSVLFFFSSVAYAGPTRDVQVEAGFNLTREFAERVLASRKFKGEDRTDFYMEIYDGSQFLLIPGAMRNELRLKTTEKKAVLQANVRDAVQDFTCSDGLKFQIKTKLVGNLPLGDRDSSWLEKAVEDQLRLIASSDHRAVVDSVQSLNRYVNDSGLPLLDRLKSVGGGKRIITASHISRKTKWKATLSDRAGDVTVSITEAKDYSGDDYIQTKYEVEFQPESDMPKNDVGRIICDFMSEQRYTAADLAPSRLNSQELALKRLKPFNGDLGF